jgi:hypothetical protein
MAGKSSPHGRARSQQADTRQGSFFEGDSEESPSLPRSVTDLMSQRQFPKMAATGWGLRYQLVAEHDSWVRARQ